MAEVLIDGIRVFDAASSLQGAAAVPAATNAVQLVRLGAFTGTGATASGRAESVDFDPASDKLYITNAALGKVDIASIGADGAASAAGVIDLTGLTGYGGVNSVAVKGGVVAVAYGASAGDQPGYVALFDTATNTLQKLIQVGVLPDQLTFSADGKKLLVANEAEAVSAANNANGTISIIDLSGGAASATVSNTIGFTALNGSEAVLKAHGLALYPGQTAAADIEPEYIAISPDGTRAYVTLQEVNGVAVIDLTDPTASKPIAIQPLGGVDHNLTGNAFDPSDRDAAVNGGVNIAKFDVIGLLQPDAVASFSVGGATYFITANEGDARVGTNLVDEVRVNASSYTLDIGEYPNRAALEANDQLGRLNVFTHVGNTDADPEYEQVYAQGGRGISIFRQNADGTISKVRETGGEFERIIAQLYPSLHNAENQSDFDGRSDNKGPEPEGVSVGVIDGRIYAFVTLERAGGVMIYDVTQPSGASFVGYKPATGQDFAPEVVKFISAADSPTGQALLVSANEVSGTTTIYTMESAGSGDDSLLGASGTDALFGLSGVDTVSGLGGADTLNGGSGDDSLSGGAEGDRLIGDSGQDVLDGGTGADTLVGDSGADTLTGGTENDSLNGGSVADLLEGGEGADTIDAGTGADTIVGGAGADSLIGGSGADVFVYGLGAGTDVIAGFNVGQDVLDLTQQTGPIYGSVDGDALISFADGTAVRLMGVSLNEYFGL